MRKPPPALAKRNDGSTINRVNFNLYDVRYLSQQGSAGEIANMVSNARLIRFLRQAIDHIRDTMVGGSKQFQLGAAAVAMFKNQAMNHLYRILFQFVMVYASMHARLDSNANSFILQGSFLPDFMRIVDQEYNQNVASTFCPLEKHTRGRSSSILEAPVVDRSLRNQFVVDVRRTRRRRGGPSTAAAGIADEATSTAVETSSAARRVRSRQDLSCILVSESGLLSRNVFSSLSYFLSEQLAGLTGKKNSKYVRFSTAIAIEINQAYVFLLYRGVELALIIASYRSKPQQPVVRIRPADVEEAYLRILPTSVNVPQQYRLNPTNGSSSSSRRRSRSRRRQRAIRDDTTA